VRRTSGWGHGSAIDTTARRDRSSRSTETTSRSDPSQTGDPAWTTFRGGPPVTGTIHTQPASANATCSPFGEITGVVSSQYGAGSRPAVSLDTSEDAMSRTQTSEVSRSWTNAASVPSAETECERGRSVAATASSRQKGGCGSPRRVGVGKPPNSSLPIHGERGSAAMTLLDPLQRGADEPADGGEIVAAFLDHDGRQAE
jgi:hypothetical protein